MESGTYLGRLILILVFVVVVAIVTLEFLTIVQHIVLKRFAGEIVDGPRNNLRKELKSVILAPKHKTKTRSLTLSFKSSPIS